MSADFRRTRARRRAVGLGVIVAGLAVWGLVVRQNARAFREEMGRARVELESGYPATAAGRLRNLSEGRSRDPEVFFRLGVCEMALGRTSAAIEAWERVPADSTWFPAAAATRADALVNTGHYRPAEDLLEQALPLAREPADALRVRRALSRLYRFEGRVDDVRRVLRETWAESDDRPGLLRELWLLDNSPQPVESWRRALGAADPEDDRVKLGFAAVSTLTAQFDEAAKWLVACEQARPDDPAVWRARLDLGLALGDEPGVWLASARLPADRLGVSEPLAVRAWLLARGNDRLAEREALRALVEAEPGRVSALDRLAALEVQAGHREEASRLLARKAELDQAKDQFRKLLLGEPNLTAKADEFARLAAVLGRPFDAWAWSRLAGKSGGPWVEVMGGSGASLADRLAAAGLKPPARSTARHDAADSPLPASLVPAFTDDAEASGLRFVFDNGETSLRQLPETMSGGVAVLDFDGDGWLDVYTVQGGPIEPDPSAGSPSGTDRLFRNSGDGTFKDVSTTSGIDRLARGYGLGVLAGDYDGDGRTDLFVSRLSSYALYRNRGDGTFEDVTAKTGLAGHRDNPTSAAFADLDGDGDLDLYVCHYMVWNPADPRLCKNEKGDYFYCDPSRVDAAPDHVFRNDGGTFVDVTNGAGFTDPNGRGLGVVAADFDGDGKVDLFVANDGTGNYLFRNLGGFKFEEVAQASGVACSGNGGFQASMGVACGDYNGDGRPDLLVTNFYGESSTLSENLGQGMFRDVTAPSGVGAATRHLLGFGTSFVDVNNDGRLDLVTANGHVNDNRPFYPYAMPAQLLIGRPGDRLVDASSASGPSWGVPRVGRGLAEADLDNDGKMDVLILPQNDPLVYLHNKGSEGTGQFVTFGLEGVASNREGFGATVTVEAGGRRQVAQRYGGGSYQSSPDRRLHFGLGPARSVDSVEVRWPSGKTDRFKDLPAGTGYRLREGAESAAPLKGFGR